MFIDSSSTYCDEMEFMADKNGAITGGEWACDGMGFCWLESNDPDYDCYGEYWCDAGKWKNDYEKDITKFNLDKSN